MFFSISFLIILLITIINYYNKNNYLFNYKPNEKQNLKVSILIPAKNEEKRIGKCLELLLKQDYPNLEIIVLDDNSSDNTFDFVNNNYDVNIVKGAERPHGWNGKNWACWQLSKLATGDIIIFTDADNYFEKNAISKSISYLIDNNYSMLSCFPEIHNLSISEKIFVPLVDNILTSLLPLSLVRTSKNPSFSAANGQWIVIKKEVYFGIGGHECVKNSFAEDIAIAKKLKEKKYKISTLLGKNIIYTRMYENIPQIINGFSKNMFYMLGGNLFINLIFIYFLWSSLIILFNYNLYFILLIIIYFYLQTTINSKFNISTFLTFIPRYFFILIMSFISFYKIKTKKVVWKK
jgi:chlorobactene glucosyltransferase